MVEDKDRLDYEHSQKWLKEYLREYTNEQLYDGVDVSLPCDDGKTYIITVFKVRIDGSSFRFPPEGRDD